jgi:hypothetical protein
MNDGNSLAKNAGLEPNPRDGELARSQGVLHPAWRAFVRYCGELQHGEIERLKIQDGLPVLAEVTKKKVKFA